MKTIQMRSAVDGDGVLTLRIPIGREDAGQEVTVTVEPAMAGSGSEADEAEWHQILRDTYGACAGLGLERADQGVLEEREPIE